MWTRVMGPLPPRAPPRSSRRRARPRHLARDQPAGAEPRRVAHRDRRRARIERPDISAGTTADGEPEPAALAYGEAVHAAVPPELASRLVHDEARTQRLRRRVPP